MVVDASSIHLGYHEIGSGMCEGRRVRFRNLARVSRLCRCLRDWCNAVVQRQESTQIAHHHDMTWQGWLQGKMAVRCCFDTRILVSCRDDGVCLYACVDV